MKKVYIKRNDLFKPLDMVLCNNIIDVDGSFIDDNLDVFYEIASDDDVDDEINRLVNIDWSKEEYKPYDITDKMNPEELHKHLVENHYEDIRSDIEPEMIEPYQYYIIDGYEWDIERLKEYNVTLGYSEALNVHVLPIYDFGTPWSHFSYSKEVDDDYELLKDESFKKVTTY